MHDVETIKSRLEILTGIKLVFLGKKNGDTDNILRFRGEPHSKGYYLYNVDNNTLFTALYVGDFCEDLAGYSDLNNGKMGYINRDLEIVIQPEYVMVGDFYNGFAIVTLGQKVRYEGLIDKDNKLILEPVHMIQRMSFFDHYIVERNRLKGVFSPTKGDYIVSPEYEEITELCNDDRIAFIRAYKGNIYRIYNACGMLISDGFELK